LECTITFMQDIDPELLKVLACPACEERPPVERDGDAMVCTKCGRRYPIRDGIPVMLIDEAETSTALPQE